MIRDPVREDKLRSDRSAGDRRRHTQKVKQAIKDQIADILSDEAIIGKSGDKIIKVPIKVHKEYRFVYGDNTPGVGSGGGNESKGDIIPGQQQQGKSNGQAGDQPGTDYYETEVTLDELVEILFEDLSLPYEEQKKLREMKVEVRKRHLGHRRKGIRARLSLPKSARERVRRLQQTKNAIRQKEREVANLRGAGREEDAKKEEEVLKTLKKLLGELLTGDAREKLSGDGKSASRAGRFPFRQDDLRYKHIAIDERYESNAVVFCIMDTSGSMDTLKKYLARSFFFLLYRFIKTKYSNVHLVFISHHTEAREVTEEEFFHKGESGGTFISSGYLKALEIIKERYDPAFWNVYAFHCSDGDNFESDNDNAVKALKEIVKVSNLVGYGEIKPQGYGGYYGSGMMNLFKSQVKSEHFHTVLIKERGDIWPKFKEFMSKDKAREAS